ncbi:MAG: hydrogenase maturation nickel metallochaperone HypA [Firmicutes bacterium]|nr:hydrogenase maturation nickel metallochaperone HypA [Bacillota bacterium]
MHELGVVFYIVRDVKKVAEENNVEKVHSVTIQLGEVSGVVFELLEDCWNWAAKKEPILAGAKLICEQVDAITYCEDCQQTYPTVQYGKVCPHCKSERTYLLQGNEFSIKEIEVV